MKHYVWAGLLWKEGEWKSGPSQCSEKERKEGKKMNMAGEREAG